MPRNARVSFVVTLVVSLVVIAVACNQEKSDQTSSTSSSTSATSAPRAEFAARALAAPAVTVTLPPPGQPPVFPADTPVPAPTASLSQAAVFAWQEFIAATWPAQPCGTPTVCTTSATATFNRDVPDPNGVYGATAGMPTGAPLVWETFRHKVEIFPGTTSANYQTQAPPHGLNLNATDLGYRQPTAVQLRNLSFAHRDWSVQSQRSEQRHYGVGERGREQPDLSRHHVRRGPRTHHDAALVHAGDPLPGQRESRSLSVRRQSGQLRLDKRLRRHLESLRTGRLGRDQHAGVRHGRQELRHLPDRGVEQAAGHAAGAVRLVPAGNGGGEVRVAAADAEGIGTVPAQCSCQRRSLPVPHGHGPELSAER